MRVLVTGSRGFVGKNLLVRFSELDKFEVLEFSRSNSIHELKHLVSQADTVIHLAGENRPKELEAYEKVNTNLTKILCDSIRATGRQIAFVLASSIQAELNNPYGTSKREAEKVVEQLASETGNPAVIYRLPNVFGKWCKPNYNSVVATFCHNIANDLNIDIKKPSTQLKLVYIDDVVTEFLSTIQSNNRSLIWGNVEPVFHVTLGELADQIKSFRSCRSNLVSGRVGTGLKRALYATYVSYLPSDKFYYSLPCYGDERGLFVEMLKTPDCGQFSYFTARPGVTRGGHYHHTKTEKFLVIKGEARFGFRHILTDERHELYVSGEHPQIVESVPGWSHDITNIGDKEMVVMLWANEVFDRSHPDTYTHPV